MTHKAEGCGYLAVSQWEVAGASQWRKGTLCSLIWMSYRPYKQQKPVRQKHTSASCNNRTKHKWHACMTNALWHPKKNPIQYWKDKSPVHRRQKKNYARYFASHLYKVIPHNFGSHQHKHDGKAIGHVPCGFYQDYRETEGHSDNATCQINNKTAIFVN